MPTQLEVARHLDMSERNARTVLRELGIDWKKKAMSEIRVAYIRNLREKAAGRGLSSQEELNKSKIRDAEAGAVLKEIQAAEKVGALVPIQEAEPRFAAMVVAARTEFMTMADKLRQKIQTRYGVEVDPDLINENIHSALRHLSSHDADAVLNDGKGGTGVGTTA